MNGGKPAGTASADDEWIFVNSVASPLYRETVSPEYEASETEGTPPPALTPIYIVAHSERAQQLFDMVPLSWGVQYEIARGVSQGAWSWETVVESESALRQSLCGPNTNASRVSQVLAAGHSLGDALPLDDVWSELDREDAAIAEGQGRGLGLQGDFMGQQDWYGGKIQQVATLQEEGDGFRLVLAKMEIGKSNRFARFMGSRRMLQVSIPYNVVSGRADELREFFAQKFVLCGRVYVAFCVKGTRVFLMETPEDYERAAFARGDGQRITLMDFLTWHNPMDRNCSQLISEWVSSFDLGLSSSVPVLSIPPENVYQMEDQVAPLDDPDMEPPPEYIYTDGCGWINDAALSAIARHMGLKEWPTAVQGRFGGAEGLWVLHPEDQSSTPKIWIRESQVKIKLDFNNLHPAHSIFELLGVSRVTPSRLSRAVILNLAHNGVPKETFVGLMKDMIDEEVKPLMEWSGPKAMLLLSKAIESLKIGRGWMKYELNDQSPGSTAQPRRTIHNVVLDLLQAGFHPLKLEHLSDLLKKMVKLGMDNIIRDFHFSVHGCARAFIIPDPYGVLREGEIHFKSTKPFDYVDDLNPHLLLGDVLIYCNPCVLPSDVQKVKAVECEALSAYTDVVVVPIVGPRSFASYLAGADYNGDVAVVVYDDRLVKSFGPPPLTLEPCNFVDDNFEELSAMQQATKNFLSRLFGTAPIGLYRRFCDGSTYEYGYDAPETIRLAFMFRKLLDSQKTGRRVKEGVLKRDKRQFTKELPPSLQSMGNGPWRRNYHNTPYFKRDPKLGEFILDYLLNTGQEMLKEQIKHFDRLKPRHFCKDDDLLQPWKKMKQWIGGSSPAGANLGLIQAHVDGHIEEWRTITARTMSNRSARWTTGKSAQAQYDELARTYAAGPEISLDGSLLGSSAKIEQLKASYAYTAKPGFAWSVAFQTLCQMKKGAQGSQASVADLPDA
ncbi:hypothetical protein V8D89_006361 [Ganoderma adspersum]